MVLHTQNHSTWEAEAPGKQIPRGYYSSVVEHLPRMNKALGLITSTTTALN